jgi:hypothetical protein
MSAHYYQILGIIEGATLEEIKQAFRSRAKELHPDKNKSPHAQQEFIALTEAYEYAIAAKANKFKRYVSPFENIEQQRQRDRAEAIKRAQEYARMRYEEFEKTEAFQTINSLNIILDHFIFLVACLLLLAIPVVITYLYTVTGFILSGLFLLAVARPVFGFIKPYFNLRQLWLAVMSLVETFFFRATLLTLTNLFIFMKIGLQTMLYLGATIAVLILPAFIAYYIVLRKEESRSRLFTSFCLVPFMVNVLFMINFWGSHNPVVEEYAFTNGDIQKSTLIDLENGTYEQYAGIRVFAGIEQMKFRSHIIYQFEDGLLGVRVMKEYRFID